MNPSARLSKHPSVPRLLSDGGFIDILWDNHEAAIHWFEKFLGLKAELKENWKPDPRVSQGKMTHLGLGLWLDSYLTSSRLPFHFAERGTIDGHVRWCWRVNHFEQMYSRFKEHGVRVSDIYGGPAGHRYFDCWTTLEGTRMTFHDVISSSKVAFPSGSSTPIGDSFVRIGVSDLEKSIGWYSYYVGMELEMDCSPQDYVVMKLGVNHHPELSYKCVLEKLPDNAFIGKVDSPVRQNWSVANREQFFKYHRFLKEAGVPTGEIGGFTKQGKVHFHFYDLDGNRFNIGHC